MDQTAAASAAAATSLEQQLGQALACFLKSNDAAAGQWLESFQHSPESWAVCVSILNKASGLNPGADFGLLVFAAQTVCSKVHTEAWKLDALGRQAVEASLFSLLRVLSSSGPHQAFTQICTAIAALFLACPGSCAELEGKLAAAGILVKPSNSSGGGDGMGTARATWVALELATVMAEECADGSSRRASSAVTLQRRHEFSEELLQQSALVAAIVWHGVQTRSGAAQQQQQLLKCILAWARIGWFTVLIEQQQQQEKGESSNNAVFGAVVDYKEALNGIICFVISCLESNDSVELAAEAIGEAAVRSEVLAPQLLTSLLPILHTSVLPRAVGHAQAKGDGTDEAALAAWARVLADLGLSAPTMVLPGPNGSCFEAFFSAVFKLMAVPCVDRDICISLLGLWSGLCEHALAVHEGAAAAAGEAADAAAAVQWPIFQDVCRQALSALTAAAQYGAGLVPPPDDMGEWSDAEEGDVLEEYREQVEETLWDLGRVLGGASPYLELVLNPLQQAEAALSGSGTTGTTPATAAAATAQWIKLAECSLFAVLPAMRDIEEATETPEHEDDELDESQAAAATAAAAALRPELRAPVQTVLATMAAVGERMRQVRAASASLLPPRLHRLVLKTCGLCAALCAAYLPAHAHLIPPTVLVLSDALFLHSDCANAAATALCTLCDSGAFATAASNGSQAAAAEALLTLGERVHVSRMGMRQEQQVASAVAAVVSSASPSHHHLRSILFDRLLPPIFHSMSTFVADVEQMRQLQLSTGATVDESKAAAMATAPIRAFHRLSAICSALKPTTNESKHVIGEVCAAGMSAAQAVLRLQPLQQQPVQQHSMEQQSEPRKKKQQPDAVVDVQCAASAFVVAVSACPYWDFSPHQEEALALLCTCFCNAPPSDLASAPLLSAVSKLLHSPQLARTAVVVDAFAALAGGRAFAPFLQQQWQQLQQQQQQQVSQQGLLPLLLQTRAAAEQRPEMVEALFQLCDSVCRSINEQVNASAPLGGASQAIRPATTAAAVTAGARALQAAASAAAAACGCAHRGVSTAAFAYLSVLLQLAVSGAEAAPRQQQQQQQQAAAAAADAEAVAVQVAADMAQHGGPICVLGLVLALLGPSATAKVPRCMRLLQQLLDLLLALLPPSTTAAAGPSNAAATQPQQPPGALLQLHSWLLGALQALPAGLLAEGEAQGAAAGLANTAWAAQAADGSRGIGRQGSGARDRALKLALRSFAERFAAVRVA